MRSIPAPRRDHWAGERYDPNTDKVYRGGYDTGIGQFAPRSASLPHEREDRDSRGRRYQRRSQLVPLSARRLSGHDLHAILRRHAVSPRQARCAPAFPEVVGPDLNQKRSPLPAAVGTTTFPQDFHRGYVESWNFTVAAGRRRRINMQAAYVGSRGIRQTVNQNINAAGPGGGNAGRALFPQFARISDVTYFDALQHREVQRPATSGDAAVRRIDARCVLHVLEDHWLCRRYRLRADLELGARCCNGTGRLPASTGRTTSSSTAITSCRSDAGKLASSGIASAIAGGWQVNWILSRTSGTPFTVATSGTSVNAPGNTQTADQVKPEVAILGGHGVGSAVLRSARVRAVTAVRFGNTGRNILRGPGVFNLDGSVFRELRGDGAV